MSRIKQRDILKSKSDNLKQALTGNFNDLKQNSKEVITGAIIGGSVLLCGLIIYRLLRSNEPEDISESSEKIIVVRSPQESTLMKSIKESIATFLLAIAKQKILDYIDKQNKEGVGNE